QHALQVSKSGMRPTGQIAFHAQTRRPWERVLAAGGGEAGVDDRNASSLPRFPRPQLMFRQIGNAPLLRKAIVFEATCDHLSPDDATVRCHATRSPRFARTSNVVAMSEKALGYKATIRRSIT
ncbi:MAG: hypothetical protein O3B24_08410, partial [Verrucomicrobia bacterium]|nr:hypothetical protein [Verrucomicrobiota bacterium]